MRSSIKWIYAYYNLILIAAVFLIPFNNAAEAKPREAVSYTIFGEIIKADPGEDPHMKVDPLTDLERILDLNGGRSLAVVECVDIDIMRQHRTIGYIAGIRNFLVKTKSIITIQILPNSLY